jgi:SAM-dependent methyltransferase
MDDDQGSVRANVERWSAADDAWRGYRQRGGQLVLEERIEKTLGLLLPLPGAAMLDVGCADGVLTKILAKKVGAKRVVGIDVVASAKNPGCLVVNLDSLAPLPFADASFDVVTCLETLEHVHVTDHLAHEIRRVLKPSGYAVLSVPRIDGVLTIAMLLAGMQPPAVECSLEKRYGSPEPGGRVSGHVSHFTRRALEELLGASGLQIEAFAQASIYSGWRLAATETPPAWKRLPLWMLSKLPFKQDVQIVRARRA